MSGIFADKHHIHEPVWHVQLAMLVAIGLQITLPDRFAPGPHYILPAAELLLLLLLGITTPRKHIFKSLARTTNVVLLIATASIANIYSLIFVLDKLLQTQVTDGHALLFSAINIYVTNIIIFGLWYYEMDGGGPGRRQEIKSYEQDFLFPQHRNDTYRHPEWRPYFVDYLYASATNAMTFGPTDTLPLSRRAKLLMLAQTTVSIATVALVAARAIGILQ